MTTALELQIKILDSVTALSKSDWVKCFPDEIEDWDFYRAIEISGLPDFSFFYITIWQANEIIGLAPAFVTRYALDTTLEPGILKSFFQGLQCVAPGLFQMRLASLGSPIAERCHIGLSKHSGTFRDKYLNALHEGLERIAVKHHCSLIAIKDISEMEYSAQKTFFRECGFHEMSSLATAYLDIPLQGMPAYLQRLSRATRKDMKRKLRNSQLRIEERETIVNELPMIESLYHYTLERSDLQFERLPGTFFQAVLETMKGRSRIILYWLEDQLVAFNLILIGQDCLIDKYIGISPVGREHNAYFASWFYNVELCMKNGLKIFYCGQALSEPKRRLGATFSRNVLLFKHRNRIVNVLLRLISPLFQIDDMPATRNMRA